MKSTREISSVIKTDSQRNGENLTSNKELQFTTFKNRSHDYLEL